MAENLISMEEASAQIFEILKGRPPLPEELDILVTSSLDAAENGLDPERTAKAREALQAIAMRDAEEVIVDQDV